MFTALVNAAGVWAAAYLLADWIITGVPVPHDVVGSATIVCALVTTIGWNLLTWWWGMPSSSTTPAHSPWAMRTFGAASRMTSASAGAAAPDCTAVLKVESIN